MKKHQSTIFKLLGPGFVVAATGVGAGDMIAAAVSGAKFGTIILWSAVFGAIVKFVLNEGIARWQLASDTTLLEGWAAHLHRLIPILFVVYLIVWSFIVAGALISACGLAAHAMVPQLSVEVWGVAHSILAVVLVYVGRYGLIEKMMKIFVGLMFTVVIACAIMVKPHWLNIFRSVAIPVVPPGSGKFILGVIGGVGGSVTLLSYGYWIREKQWMGPKYKKYTQIDLASAYFFTGLFGVAIMIIAAGVNPGLMSGSEMVLEVANQLGKIIGASGKWVFLAGFWGAVFSSMLGVWQGVPYLFTDFISILRHKDARASQMKVRTDSLYYKIYLAYLAFPPMLLLLFQRPVWIVVIYAIAGAFFMPFLAGTLLYLNNRREWVGDLKSNWILNLVLLVSLALFGYLCMTEVLALL